MKKVSPLFLIVVGFFLFFDFVNASVYITPATGGEEISIATVGGAWTTLRPIIIREGMPGDIRAGYTIFVIPDGFELNSTSPPDILVTGGTGLLVHLTSASSDKIIITVSQASVNNPHTLTIGQVNPIKVRPTSSNLPSGNIYISTSTVEGVIPGAVGTNFGTLKTVPVSPPPEEKPPEQPPPEKPIKEMTIEELKAKIIEVQKQIIALLQQLIQLIQRQINQLSGV